MPKILLIDDSDEIASLVESGLTPYFVRKSRSIAEAEAALREIDYDLLLIDVSLPDGNGFDLCRRLTQDPARSGVPRILLTAKDQTSEKVYGFECGADDYITKPFHLAELRARVDRCLKRQSHAETGIFTSGCFQFNLEFQRCFIMNGDQRDDLELTPTEFRLFLTLAKSPGKVLTRKMLELVAWESRGTVIETKGINTHVAHLRRKLGNRKGCIVSVYGKGYAFRPEPN